MDIKFSSFIATSLDGYIARIDGRIDWLTQKKNSKNKHKTDPNAQSHIQGSRNVDSEDYGYRKFYDSTDCLIMGRNTFEKVASFPEWPYYNKRLIVISKRLKEIPEEYQERAELYSGTPEMLVVELQNQNVRHAYIDGGITIQSFIKEKILDQITITQVPILLGKGLPLFGTIRKDHHLELLNNRSYASGFVQSTYRLKY
ncbi:MAG: dihydrofolate reductase [Polaribacter sp.]|jgi:dihydrofolate reductase